MFVCADSYRASVSAGIYSHFKREEDPTMTRGKLDEELARMSDIADGIQPGHSSSATSRSRPPTNEKAPRSHARSHEP